MTQSRGIFEEIMTRKFSKLMKTIYPHFQEDQNKPNTHTYTHTHVKTYYNHIAESVINKKL